MQKEVTKLQAYRREIKTESESRISTCQICGKEITFGRIFCEEHNIPINKQIYEFFSEFPKNKDGLLIRPRGKKLYQVIKYYLAARLGLSKDKRVIMKSCTGAGKSVMLDMLAFIEMTHFPNSLTIIGSISEAVSKMHIERLREWIGGSVFNRYMVGTQEATASKTEIKLAKLNSKVMAMPQSPKSRTGWHASLLLVDEIGRMEIQSYYASFSQMAAQGGTEVLASTPYLDSIVMQNIWADDNIIKIALEPEECFWIPKEVFRKKEEEYRIGGISGLYEQLYGAQFRSLTNRVIPDDLLLQSMAKGEHYPTSKNLIMGIDFGKSIDFTAIVVIDIETGDIKFVDTFQDDWPIQFAKIRKYAKEWNPIKIVADSSHIGDVILSDLRELNIEGVSMHNDILKKSVIDRLIMAFFNNKLNIVSEEFPKLINEVSSYVYYDSDHKKMGPSGRGHDDTVIALSLALRGLDVTSVSDTPLPDNLWSFTRINERSSSDAWRISNV